MQNERAAAFVNWVNKMAGLPYTGKLNARSFMKIGKKVSTPRTGDIVILWRDNPKSWKGHVGYYIRSSKDQIWILGGNQENEVKIKAYPKSRLLEYRRL